MKMNSTPVPLFINRVPYTEDMGPEVNGVQFEEPELRRSGGGGSHFAYAKIVASNEPPAIIKWLLDNKVVSSEQQAVNIVLGSLIAIFLIAGYLFFFSGSKSQIEYAAEIQQRESNLSR